MYEAQLLSIKPDEMVPPEGSISYGDFTALVSLKTTHEYERELRKLTKKLPFQTSSWPSFDGYVEEWYKVEVGEFKMQLQVCERGKVDVAENFKTLVDLSYRIIDIVSPNLTASALKIAEKLDRIKDQRLLIWLRMSSEIFHMYQVNEYFGMRMLIANVTWMCEELVRMGLFRNTTDAFENERHILQGLMLSGLPKDIALELYMKLKNG